MSMQWKLLVWVLWMILFQIPAPAQTAALDHRLGMKEPAVVPESFLRSYDPVTVFFPVPEGPADGGPADQPGKLMEITPAHPGEFRWIDGRTLQFLPAIPWQPLEKYIIRVKGRPFELTALLPAPETVLPTPGSREMEPFREITLIFSQRLDPDKLAGAIRVDVRPVPGLDAEEGFVLTRKDFTVKEMERPDLQSKAAYRLTFQQPFPDHSTITLHVQLMTGHAGSGSPVQYQFHTRTGFRLLGVGVEGGSFYPFSSKGGVYTRDQAMNCGSGQRGLRIRFSSELQNWPLEEMKKLVQFEPAVRNLTFSQAGDWLNLKFDADREQIYHLTLRHVPLSDLGGRSLAAFGEASLYFYFSPVSPFLRWQAAEGILERFGPQQFPLEGRNMEKVDLRIHKIDPLSENFWPFPQTPVPVNETDRPPGPGEEPAYGTALREQLKILGSPLISRIIALPFSARRGPMKAGLDLRSLLAEISGLEQPGTYLAGYRILGTDPTRHYIRLTVTDLAVTVTEEPPRLVFHVTSLRTGLPVTGARVVLEARKDGRLYEAIAGKTDIRGEFIYSHQAPVKGQLIRLYARSGQDLLVIDPRNPPPQFADNHWSENSWSWLSWLQREPAGPAPPQLKAHILTERPVYRPEEPVHIKGYIRQWNAGQLSTPANVTGFTVQVRAPGEKNFTYPLTLNVYGSFYLRFAEKDLPTGDYQAAVLDGQDTVRASVPFKVEAYRIPRFEIRLENPDRVPMDAPCRVNLRAVYYAGGAVAGQPVSWKITPYLYRQELSRYPGFQFSSQAQFAGEEREAGEPSGREAVTDENGSASLELNPEREEDGRPREYVVEATVRGADEQTVTATTRVLALPAFTLGIQQERVIKDNLMIRPRLLVLGHDGQPRSGFEFTVTISRRQWHSYLASSDFTTGKAKYVTDVVDHPVAEQRLVSGNGPLETEFPVKESGVYLVEVSATDRLGRRQSVTVDLFVAGGTPVAWKKPKASVFETALDKKKYDPGDTAEIILKSPFQKGQALVMVESATGTEHHWVAVENGQGLFSLPVRAEMAPRAAVHILLLRGRLDGPAADPEQEDRNRPRSLANTTWVEINPRHNQLKLKLEHPEQALPGSEMPVTLIMEDPDGHPLNGEVALWLVDRAVLALGKERPLDPVPSFLVAMNSDLHLRDTRNKVIGSLFEEESPGGDGAKESERLFDHLTVRKNFQSVPYYQPSIEVINGRARVMVKLSDDLTDFAVRAVATDGQARFGFAKSAVAVRLPVIVQPALPRFLRPGDSFLAGGIGRLVEGDGGSGSCRVEAAGLELTGEASRPLVWQTGHPLQLFFDFRTPPLAEGEVKIRLAVRRDADGAGDAFELKVPVIAGRTPARQESFAKLVPGRTLEFPVPAEPPLPGSVRQRVVLTYETAVVKMLAGLDYLASYPHGCTEQRVSQMLPEVAMRPVLTLLGRENRSEASRLQMEELFKFLERAQEPGGLFSYWPGSAPSVSLTAYVAEFLVLAKKGGYPYRPAMLERSLRALQDSLRSDYSRFTSGYEFVERAESLTALALAGRFQESYAHDLLARSLQMDLYSEARVMQAFLTRADGQRPAVNRLRDDLWKSLVFKLRNGQEVYEGLQYRGQTRGGPILSSEVKTVSSVLKALHTSDPQNPRVRVLVEELASRGAGDGWGSTNANAAALLALGQVLTFTPAGREHSVTLAGKGEPVTAGTGGKPVTLLAVAGDQPAKLQLAGGDAASAPLAWMQVDYYPAATLDQLKQKNDGFVVDRELLVILPGGQPPLRRPVVAGQQEELETGAVVEEHVRVVNSEDRFYVAVEAPFAAGLEPLNPALANAPAEARPAGKLTLEPSFALYDDDRVVFYYDYLPKGTYDFYFRLRAMTAGSFTHPPARAELMYNLKVSGRSAGMRIRVQPRPAPESK